MKRKYNWGLIQHRYNEGITIEKLCNEFGCSIGAVDAARNRGDFIPRNKQLCQLNRHIIHNDRLKEIAILYDNDASYREILKKGYAQAEYIAAREQGFFKPRTRTESAKLKIKKFGQNKMGPDARKRLSERQSLNNTGGKSKWYEVAGQKVQGTWERNVALKFEELKIKWIKPKTNNDLFLYTMNCKEHRYAPDFYLPEYDVYLEIKGYWWGNDREKMNIVLDTYKDKRIIIIEEENYKRILQGERVWL